MNYRIALKISGFLSFCLLLILAVGCGLWITVHDGDTLYSIAKENGVTVNDMLGANPSVKDPNTIHTGQKLKIPRSGRSISDSGAKEQKTPASNKTNDRTAQKNPKDKIKQRDLAPPITQKPTKTPEKDKEIKVQFIWPVSGTIISHYGKGPDGQLNEGIDIAAPAGTKIVAAADGEVGLDYARNNPYDVLVLDLLLPKVDGMGVLAGLRGKPDRPHVLILTARDRVEDRVLGLNEGADDYLVKPFAFDELLARIHALVRRRYEERSRRIAVGGVELDLVGRNASHRGARLDLTAREYALLEYLLLRRGQIVTREEIEDHIYGVHKLPASNAVDSTICLLRAKLGPEGKDVIRTLRGRGYVLDEPRA